MDTVVFALKRDRPRGLPVNPKNTPLFAYPTKTFELWKTLHNFLSKWENFLSIVHGFILTYFPVGTMPLPDPA